MQRIKIWSILSIALAIVSCQKPEPELIIDGDLTVAYGEEFYIGGYGISEKKSFFHSSSLPPCPEPEQGCWSSSNSNVVEVLDSESGRFYACGIGEADIYLELWFNGGVYLSASCHVTVVSVEMTSLELSETSCRIEIGESHNLVASFKPDSVTFPKLYWHSSNEDIATVKDGTVSAVGIGDCVISVTNADSSLTALCDVSVYVTEMTSLELSETNCRIEIGKTHSLVASFEPDSVTFPELYWHSSDESIAMVKDGTVSAVGIGDCVISVTNADSSLTAQCNVSVYVIEMTSISCAAKVTKEQFESFNLEATPQPLNATTYNEALRWHSSDESIATVDELTGEVNCVGVGECTITISNIYNSVTAECHLTVTHALVKKLSLSQSSLYLPIADSQRLHCTISPENAYNKDVKWESSNTLVATVSEDGTVTAVGEGVATIKVTALDGSGCIAECSVVVGTAGTEEEYVQDYIANNVSIQLIGTKWHESLPIMYFIFKITNNGDDTVYLERAYNRMINQYIEKDIEPGGTYEISIAERELSWVFFMHNIMVTK